MANPATGGTYEELLAPGLNAAAVRKAIVTDLLIRDYNGSSTDLSAAAAGLDSSGKFTPFAQDGELREDLLVTATGSNLGFYHLGLLSEDGIKYTANTDNSETLAAQIKSEVRIDITRESVSLNFTLLEGTPVVDALANDLPLLGLQELGETPYHATRPISGNIVERQIIALLFDGTHYAARVIPRTMRAEVGDNDWSKANADRLDLTYRGLPCPFAGYLQDLVREGTGWRSLGGTPVFAADPVATQTGATTATVAHAIPTSSAPNGNDEFTYVVEKSVSPFSAWTTATVGSSTPSGGNITHSITGLTTATQYKFRVKATSSNAQTTTSNASNTITTA